MGLSSTGKDATLDQLLVQLTGHMDVAKSDVAYQAVAQVVQQVVGSLDGELSAEDLHLYREVEQLAGYIHDAREEIAALNPTDIKSEYLPTATDELDAIIQATEQATGSIMDATEVIEDVSSSLTDEAAVEALQQAVTSIYEACSFQDITGQRITKIVRMLKSIEARVDALVQVFDPAKNLPPEGDAENLQQAGNHGRLSVAARGDKDGDQALLNGPQDAESAMGQDDIDALLRGFD